MSPSQSSSLTNAYVQVIDGDGNFSADEKELNKIIQTAQRKISSNSTNVNEIPYSIISIMGCQSTGKSTLLNLLFGTSFRTMEASSGRSQTTKGVWLDSGNLRQSLVVMDLEGTDSGERGEDRTTFERQTALYALALAEVLIINMWEHDIGRYTASNYGILKTIFEVHLQMFAPTHKTILMFMIRDHIEEETPYQALKVKLFDEVQRIWSELRKPEAFQSKNITDLFEFRYTVLPHMKLQKHLFQEKVNALREQFIDPTNKDYLFKSPASQSAIIQGAKSVPSDGFGHFAHNVWTTIKDNKELNLPTQREMLATFRCDEIIGLLVVEFFTAIATTKEAVSSGLMQDFGQASQKAVESILATYDQSTQHYHAEIVARKRNELIQRLSDELQPLFVTQSRFVVSECASIFASHLRAQLLNDDEMDERFYEYVEEGRRKAEKHFSEKIALLNVPLFNWKHDQIEEELNNKLELALNKEKTKQLAKLEPITEKMVKDELSPALSAILKKASRQMWREIAEVYLQTTEDIKDFAQVKCAAYKCATDETEHYKNSVNQQSSTLIRLLIDQYAAMILLHMRNRFDRQFRYDSDGIPRRWKSAEEIRKVYNTAKEDALSLLNLFSVFRLNQAVQRLQRIEGKNTLEPLSPSHDDIDRLTFDQSSSTPDLIVITNLQQLEKESQFRIDVEGALREVENEYERKIEARRLPTWGLALIAFLGWNEFLAILRNPLLLILIVVIGGGIYVLYTLNLLDPALFVARNVYQQCLNQLMIIIQQIQQKQRVMNTTQTSSSPLSNLTRTNSDELRSSRIRASPSKSISRSSAMQPKSPTSPLSASADDFTPRSDLASPLDQTSPRLRHQRNSGNRLSRTRKGSDLKRSLTISRTTSKEIEKEIRKQMQENVKTN